MIQSDSVIFEHDAPLIGDRWQRNTSGGLHTHINPSRGVAQVELWLGGAVEIEAAVQAATVASKVWRGFSGDKRRRLLERLAEMLEANASVFTTLSARESGIPIRFGGGVVKAVSWARYYAGWADRIGGGNEEIEGAGGGAAMAFLRREPFGVVGAIIPWNFPLIGVAMKVFPALAAGNAVVLKPPSLAPFVALKIGAIALEAGLPAGLLSVVPGDAAAGEALVRSPEVGKVSFTGGEMVARRVLALAAETLKPTALELGGKSANILFDDADLDSAAVTAAMNGCVYVSGQGCTLPTRLLVQDTIYDDVVERVRQCAAGQRQGDAEEADTVIGPVINHAAQERIFGVIDTARRTGAGRLIQGGGKPDQVDQNGYFVAPTVFADVDPASTLWRDEIFGPVLSIGRFRDEQDAVRLANDSRFGLGAAVSTRDLDRALRLSRSLEAGMIWINGFSGPQPQLPFGGMKQSGFGREGGREGLDEFLQPKSIWIGYAG